MTTGYYPGVRRMVVAVALAACSKRSEPVPEPPPTRPPAPVTNTTPRTFFAAGTPTFVVGTAGDERVDRAIAGQAELLRSMVFPTAELVADTAVDPAAWPARPLIYGGPHVNTLLAKLTLPFSLAAGKLSIGGETFDGDGYALIAVVPAQGNVPELLLYAGTGTPGIEEINSSTFGRADAPIVIGDAFGPLVTGTWDRGADGTLRAVLGARARRVNWRATEQTVANVAVTYRFWDGAPAAGDAAPIAEASRGIATVMSKLSIDARPAMTVYVHPDQRSKAALTGNGGDGHAVPLARTLHVWNTPGLDALVAHEATHVILPQVWGHAGSALLGEGVAVWVAGQYGGTPFASFRPAATATIADLLGAGFRKLPEGTSYPLAAIFVDVAIQAVGLAGVREHLYGASPATWADACKRAGTTAEALEAAFSDRVQQRQRPPSP